MKTSFLLLVALVPYVVMFAGWHACDAKDTVTIGGVELPADCALALKEHPRLLFTQADLPRLRGSPSSWSMPSSLPRKARQERFFWAYSTI